MGPESSQRSTTILYGLAIWHTAAEAAQTLNTRHLTTDLEHVLTKSCQTPVLCEHQSASQLDAPRQRRTLDSPSANRNAEQQNGP